MPPSGDILDVSQLPHTDLSEPDPEELEPLDPSRDYIWLSIGFTYDIPGLPLGGYAEVSRTARHDLAPVEYDAKMERTIYKDAHGKEWYRVVDRHNNLVGT